MRAVALLRGINVGGNNPLKMRDLKESLEESGFTGVRTYINSGNILFSSEQADILGIQTRWEQLLRDRFGLAVPVAVLSAERYLAALDRAPDWWGRDTQTVHDAIFPIPPVTAEQVVAQVGKANEAYERVLVCRDVIFWSAPRATFSRTRWSKVLGCAAYQSITVRGVNTARRLAALLRDPPT